MKKRGLQLLDLAEIWNQLPIPGNRLSGKPGCWLLGSHWVGPGRPGGLLSHRAARGTGLRFLGTNPR